MSPCKGCGKRQPGCHDRCASYQAWVRPLIEDRERRKEYQEIQETLNSGMKKSLYRLMNEKKRLGRNKI